MPNVLKFIQIYIKYGLTIRSGSGIWIKAAGTRMIFVLACSAVLYIVIHPVTEHNLKFQLISLSKSKFFSDYRPR
jgi:hypothetical protein